MLVRALIAFIHQLHIISSFAANVSFVASASHIITLAAKQLMIRCGTYVPHHTQHTLAAKQLMSTHLFYTPPKGVVLTPPPLRGGVVIYVKSLRDFYRKEVPSGLLQNKEGPKGLYSFSPSIGWVINNRSAVGTFVVTTNKGPSGLLCSKHHTHQ